MNHSNDNMDDTDTDTIIEVLLWVKLNSSSVSVCLSVCTQSFVKD